MPPEIKFRELTIDDKGALSPFLLANDYGICDFSFSNMFMWRYTHIVSYTFHKGFLVVLSTTACGEPHFLMPLGNGDLQAVIYDLIEWSNGRGDDFKMFCLTDKMLNELAFLGQEFKVEPADIWDYVHEREDLVHLAGKKLHGKRNHIHKFDSLYSYEYAPLEPAHLPQCLELLDGWVADNEPGPSVDAEYRAVREAFDNYAALGLTGGCLFVDGVLGAFTMGQPLNDETFVIHVEKALYKYEGIYAKINQMFAENGCAGYRYINREEDMGLPGLRKAKMSYQPAILLEKHVGVLPYGHGHGH